MPRTKRPAGRQISGDLTDLRVGLYCRVSRDGEQDEKSTQDQAAVGRDWIEKNGARLAGEYIEKGSRSASRFATKEREEFTRLCDDVAAGKLDVVWVWAIDRSNRNLKVFAELRDLFQTHGVWLSVNGRMHDPNNYDDWMMLGFTSIFGERYSEELSKNVTRGKKSSAHGGRRAGRVPYGYRRVFAPDGTRHDEPDLFDGNGRPVEDSPASVVREIYSRLLGGESLTKIRQNLNDRGLRGGQGRPWTNWSVRYIATNPAYIGKRVYQAYTIGVITDRVKSILPGVEGNWPPLIDAETFWAVHRLLADRTRHTGATNAGRPRDGRARHLLSALAYCAVCGSKLAYKLPSQGRNQRQKHPLYYCQANACIGIYAHVLDDFVEKVMVRWLSDPDVAAELTKADDSSAGTQARADLEQFRGELDQLYRDAKAGRVSAVIATTTEQGLLARIAEAEERVESATLPAVLRGKIGPQAKAGWDALDVEVKRQIIRVVADIRVRQVGRRGHVLVKAIDRVTWTWLLGPEAELPALLGTSE